MPEPLVHVSHIADENHDAGQLGNTIKVKTLERCNYNQTPLPCSLMKPQHQPRFQTNNRLVKGEEIGDTRGTKVIDKQ